MSAHEERGALAWMARHRVAPNTLMAALLLGGLFMTTQIKQEVFPEFTEDAVNITLVLPGSSPEEVEEGVILAIEEEVRGLEGIDEVRATASEGRGSVTVDILTDADANRVFQDVQQAVSRITTFPNDAEEPVVALSQRKRAVMDLLIYGPVSEWALRQAAEQVRDGLLQHPDITQVELEGARELEIHAEIPEATLREYGLTLNDVASIIRQSALDRGGGSIETRSGEILLRVEERREWAREFADIAIVTDRQGAVVRLGDIAALREGFEDSDTFATFEGERAIGVNVFRIGDQTPILVAQAVKDTLPEVMASLPASIGYAIQDDDSEIYQQRLELLMKNGFIGLLLVLLVLSFFLELKLAFWVAVGIPTAFLGTLLFLPFMDVSINMVSMFAFILALGIVVDDAIVAGENIYEYRQRGMGYIEAAYKGARDIAAPISFSIMTNIIAFLPMMFVPGGFGKIWAVIPAVVASAFILSWVEALFILPAHLASVKDSRGSGAGARLHALQQRFSSGFRRFVENLYGPFLARAMCWRYLTIAVMIAILMVVLAIPMSGRLAFILMPQVESEFAQATAVLPVDASRARAEQVRDRLVSSARRVVADNGGDELAVGTFALVNENEVEVRIYLVEASRRALSTAAVAGQWRQALGGGIAGLEMLRFAADAGGPGRGPNVSLELSHRRVETLERAAADVAARLGELASVKDVDDGHAQGKTQLNFKVNDEARSLGLDAAAVASQVRARFYGAEALEQQRGRNEVTVKARLPAAQRSSEADVEQLVLITADGGEVPLYQVAELSRGRAYTNINRRNGRRVVTVTANVDPISDTSRVLAALRGDIVPQIMASYPGLGYSFEGRQASMRDAVQSFFFSCTVALFAIYMLLAVPFRSYIQPIIVMAAIPFGVVGAILGHMMMGFSLSIISMMGIIALSGVVINGALVMIDYANRRRGEGAGAFDAIRQAGVRRFRPIVLTTLTTFAGLSPMIFETSRQARFLIPMALSLGYGIVFASAIVLLLIPCLYLVVEDVKRLGRKTAALAAGGDATLSDPR